MADTVADFPEVSNDDVLGDSWNVTNNDDPFGFWDAYDGDGAQLEITGESEDPIGEANNDDDEEFDYEMELRKQEQALMEKYGVQLGTGEYLGDPLTRHMIGLGLSNIARPVDTTLLAYLTFETTSKNLCDLEELRSYTNLTSVILPDNKLRSLEPLKKMKNLKLLNAQGNLIESLQNVPLEKFKWLQALNLGHNKLESLEGIRPNTLVYLHLARNALESTEYFTSEFFPNLLSLELRGNKLTSIESLDLPKLRQLFIAENCLHDLYGINGCPSLERLHARQNQIKTLTIWPFMEKLEYINLRDNRIQNFTQTIHLENCPNAKTLILSGNPLSQSERYKDEILAACTSLKRLDRTILLELEIVEGRRRRAGRQNGTVPTLEDDPAVIVDFDDEDEGESAELDWVTPDTDTKTDQ